MGIVAVSGTASGAGKTVTAAAIAALGLARGLSVAVVKLAQIGLPRDLEEIERLAPGTATYEYARYADVLSPAAAARYAGDRSLHLPAVAKSVAALDAEFDLVLVEGTGSLLERFGTDGWTLAELAWALQAPALVVTGTDRDAPGHTALVAESLRMRGVQLAGVVIGSWPKDPDLVARCNVADLEAVTGRPLAGVLPADAADVLPADATGAYGARKRTWRDTSRPQHGEFLAIARESLDVAWGGHFDAAAFRDSADPTPAGTSITG
ncbi:ATP-dependent dethiobiotin synthetase BioD [Cryptosporangium sp. NPDC048952]|uniref:ATP-dependent dethiobiotin synthetase BioD n=1 Tax=Cryptosporangium sp. NPDC048952 TaxID=3363961 RepID=UPI00371E6805